MKVAAIAYQAGSGEQVDALLAELADDLRKRGLKLAGAVQINEPRPGESRCAMVLEDLATGERHDVSSLPTSDPSACRMDSYALEAVAGRLAGSIGPGVDLVILNRFGKQEAARGGFRAIIEAAVTHGLPLITGLNASQRPLWEAFTSGAGEYIPPDHDAIHEWACGACNRATASDM